MPDNDFFEWLTEAERKAYDALEERNRIVTDIYMQTPHDQRQALSGQLASIAGAMMRFTFLVHDRKKSGKKP